MNGKITPEDMDRINKELENLDESLKRENVLNDINANYVILANNLRGIKACDDSFDKMENLNRLMNDVDRKTVTVLQEITRIIESNSL